MCSNIQTAPAYRICTFPFIRYPTVCGSYHDILDIGLLLARKLLRTQAVNRRTADNTMTKRKKKELKGQTTIYISGITFIRYDQNRKIGKPNNLKFWEQ
jgi:hypothetical protein